MGKFLRVKTVSVYKIQGDTAATHATFQNSLYRFSQNSTNASSQEQV